MTLHRLPRSFKSFVTTVTTGQRISLLTFKELGLLLIQEEAQEKLFSTSDEKALYSKDKSGKGKPKDPKKAEEAERKRKMKCFYYENLGHSAKECRKKKADQKHKKESKGKEAAKTKLANVSTWELFVFTVHCSAYAASDDKEGPGMWTVELPSTCQTERSGSNPWRQ